MLQVNKLVHITWNSWTKLDLVLEFILNCDIFYRLKF